MIHQLKLVGTDYADAVLSGDKNYEIRFNDRGYSVGDILYQSLYTIGDEVYKHHPVSDYMYVVTFLSSMGTDCILGIHRAFRSNLVINALLRKFCDDKAQCKITLFGDVFDQAIITSVNWNSIDVNVSGVLKRLNTREVVWVEPVDHDGRSIEYCSMDFLEILYPSDFTNTHLYDIFRKRYDFEQVGHK